MIISFLTENFYYKESTNSTISKRKYCTAKYQTGKYTNTYRY